METMEVEVIRTDDVKVSAEYQFSKFHLSEKLQNALKSMKFLKPSPIQLKVIPLAKSHLDMIIQSKSGTGKTLAFSICLLECYEEELRFPQALIIVPTREIAVQIVEVLNGVGKHFKHFQANEFIGGMEMTNDRKRIQSTKVVVGTPGRILHLIRNEIFNTSKVKSIVLDEADKLLEGGSMAKDVTSIIKHFNTNEIQLIAATATVSSHLQDVMKKVMKNPIGITPKHEIPVLLGIKQFALSVPKESDNIKAMQIKIDELQKIFTRVPFKQCLLFTNSQTKTESYGNLLKKAGWKNEVINGSQDQEKRLKVLKKLMKYKCRILITTDLMARGIDIENINMVINLDIPYDSFTYLHRIGRAGRFGTHGIAITFMSGDEDITKFQKLLGNIGGDRLQILKFPQEKSGYNFWNFDDKEQDEQLEKICGFANEEESDDEESSNQVDENLLLLEISKKLVDDENEKIKSNNFDFNSLLEDYENFKNDQEPKQNGNDFEKNSNDIFSQVIKDLNLYQDEEKDANLNDSAEKVEEEKSIKKRHVIFKRANECDDDDEISTESSFEMSEDDEQDEVESEIEIENEDQQQENDFQEEPSPFFYSYNDYVAHSYQQWRNIFDFQLASIQNYVKFQK